MSENSGADLDLILNVVGLDKFYIVMLFSHDYWFNSETRISTISLFVQKLKTSRKSVIIISLTQSAMCAAQDVALIYHRMCHEMLPLECCVTVVLARRRSETTWPEGCTLCVSSL